MYIETYYEADYYFVLKLYKILRQYKFESDVRKTSGTDCESVLESESACSVTLTI